MPPAHFCLVILDIRSHFLPRLNSSYFEVPPPLLEKEAHTTILICSPIQMGFTHFFSPKFVIQTMILLICLPSSNWVTSVNHHFSTLTSYFFTILSSSLLQYFYLCCHIQILREWLYLTITFIILVNTVVHCHLLSHKDND
jgi:hypothetical protein